MLLKEQNDVSLQRGMPVEVVADSQAVVDISTETVQLYYYNSGALTIDAGQAAGVAVVAKLAQGGVLDDIGAKIGNHLNTSFAFVTGTVLTTEVEFPWDVAENGDNSSGTGQLDAIVADFANGEYCIDYRNGVIYGKKATTGTSDTANYKVAQQSSGGSTSVTSSENIAKVGGEAVVADNGAGAGVTKLVPVGGKYNAAAQTYADGDMVMFQFDTNGQLLTSGAGGGSSTAQAEYKSPSDFTATYTSTVTITLSSLPFTITNSAQVAYIKVIPSSGDAYVLINGASGVTMTVSSNVVTVAGADTTFASGDVYEVGINAQTKAYDPSTQSDKVSTLNPEYSHYTDAEQLVTASDIGAADGTYIDQGAEFSMAGYTKLGVFVKFTANNSTTNTIKFLAKHTSAGAEEFVFETPIVKTLGDDNINVYYEIDTNGVVPYIQIQSAAADVDTGGGTIGTLEIYITRK